MTIHVRSKMLLHLWSYDCITQRYPLNNSNVMALFSETLTIGYFFSATNSQAQLQISPFPSAVVVEYDSLTLTCTYTGSETFSKFAWRQTNGSDFAFRSLKCILDSNEPVPKVYQYNCSSTRVFSWTIFNVSNSRHGENWACSLDTFPDTTVSSPTAIYVVGMYRKWKS